MVPFTVASAVFGFNPDPLMVAFPVIFQTNYLMSFPRSKLLSSVLTLYFSLFFIL
jgi:hypothetical protein